MKRKIYNRLFATATLAIVVTLLLTVAVYYNLLKKQVLEIADTMHRWQQDCWRALRILRSHLHL